MKTSAFRPALVAACLVAGVASAQNPNVPAYQPQIGQPGKDVVWVPTPERLIVRMLQMADTTPGDVVFDLGSGDGRIPIAAAKKFGARSVGIEYDPDLVRYSIQAAAKEGVADRARFLREDLHQTDLSKATVVTLYVSPQLTLALRPRLLALKPGTRVTSHQFTMGDWEPDELAKVENATAYLWIVPAKAEGTWKVTAGDTDYRVRLQQEFQMLRGSAEFSGKSSPVHAARLRGEEIRFVFVDRNGDPRAFAGRLVGDAMEGVARAHGQPDLHWRAVRQN